MPYYTTHSARCIASASNKIAVYAILSWTFVCTHGIAAAQGNECGEGVYVGEVGSVPVSMKLSQSETSSSEPRVGSLYYRASWTDLLLKREPGQPEWSEISENSKLTGRFTLRCQDKQLTGEWVSVDGAKRLPITAIADPAHNYDARRVQALKPSKVRFVSVGGLGVESFVIAGPKMQGSDEEVVSGVRLLGTAPGIVKVNRLLWAESMKHVETALGCSEDFRSRFGGSAPALSFTQNVLDILWPFVIVDSRMAFECGWGMRYSIEKRVYQLTEGRKAETAQWFLNDEWKTSQLGKIITQLGESQHHKDAAECFAAAEFSVTDVYPSRQGFVFMGSFPTPSQFCSGAVDVTVPYSRLSRYLSADGKRAVKTIEKAIAHKPTP
jgi:hypothetical protein